MGTTNVAHNKSNSSQPTTKLVVKALLRDFVKTFLVFFFVVVIGSYVYFSQTHLFGASVGISTVIAMAITSAVVVPIRRVLEIRHRRRQQETEALKSQLAEARAKAETQEGQLAEARAKIEKIEADRSKARKCISDYLTQVHTLEQQLEEQHRAEAELIENNNVLQRENNDLIDKLQTLIDGLQHADIGNNVEVTLEPTIESADIARFMGGQEGVEVTEGPNVFRIESDGPVLVFDMNKIARSASRMAVRYLEKEMVELSTRYGYHGRMVRFDDMWILFAGCEDAAEYHIGGFRRRGEHEWD